MKFYSIVEISEKLEIPKNKIYYKIRSDDDFKNLFTKNVKNNSYVVPENNIENVGKAFNIDEVIIQKRLTNVLDNTINNKEGIIDSKDDIIILLKDEIEMLKNQLVEKDNQIGKLLQISQNNQVLLLDDKSNSKVVNVSFLKKIRLFFRGK